VRLNFSVMDITGETEVEESKVKQGLI